MIIGDGLIAKAFVPFYGNDRNVIVFASGVSNSGETRNEQFQREREMLLDALSKKRFLVYFSTCSIKDPALRVSPYVAHKREMEFLVREARNSAIFRLPQVVGNTPNPNTLTNFLYGRIISGERFCVWRYAKRNLIDVEDVALLASHLLRTFGYEEPTTNIANPMSISICQLVTIFESVTGKRACFDILDVGGSYEIDTHLSTEVAGDAGVTFGETYTERVIRKYYGQ